MKIAMILAAGRGERLKPLTNYLPKAMCLVKGKPLIEYHIERLAQLGFTRIVINHAYLGNQIRRYLGDGVKWNIELCYAPEPPGGLETGGGIFNALPLLGNEPFLTVNADIYTDFKFNTLALPKNSMTHLLLGSNPEHKQHGDFGLINQVQLTNSAQYTYLGIACYHPDAFKMYRAGRYSVIPMVRSLAEQQLATGELYTGLWVDVGTVERLNYCRQLRITQ